VAGFGMLKHVRDDRSSVAKRFFDRPPQHESLKKHGVKKTRKLVYTVALLSANNHHICHVTYDNHCKRPN
jgi:hypothetical protein